MARGRPFNPLASSTIDLDPIVGTRPLAIEEAEADAARRQADVQIADMRINGPQPRPGTAAWNAQGATLGIGSLPYEAEDEESVRAEFVRRFGYEPRTQQDIAFMRQQMADEQAAKLDSDLSAAGYGARRVPGPRSVDGTRPEMGTPYASVDDADAYHARPTLPSGALGPSQADEAMAARGMVPRYGADGSVGYSVAAPSGDTPNLSDQVSGRGAPGRAGARPDLEAKGYRAETVMGPTGQQRVYAPIRTGSVDNPGQSTGAGDAQDRYKNRKMKARLARGAGVSGAEAESIVAEGGVDALRDRVAYKQEDDRAAREAAWRSQMMLAGSNQRKNIVNALDQLNPAQRQQSLRYMLPGGQLAAQVDAQNAAMGGRMAQQAVTAFLAENGGAAGVVQQRMAQENRVAAKAAFDQWHANREPGLDGEYTWDQHDQQVTFLMNQYGLTQAEAEAIAQSKGRPKGARAGAPATGGRGKPAAAPSAPVAPSVGYPVTSDGEGIGTPW